MVGFQGQLVPVGEPDHAESPPREIIDLTDNSEDDVLDLSSEEECQSPYFIFALFALLTSLLVKCLHSHPLYTFATSLSSFA